MARCKQKFAVKRRECRVAVISEGRILGKFFRPTREWPSPGAKSALVTKTWAPLLGNTPREYALWGGEVIANAALCRKKG
jgi:hypothetical protein